VVDYSLYVILDRKYLTEEESTLLAEKIIKGGCSVLQYRDKTDPSKYSFDLAKKLFKVAKDKKIPFIINDRVDIAIRLGADGVHVGEKDMPVKQARSILGPHKIVGKSVHNWEEARAAEREDADYVGAGPVFRSQTKEDDRELISRDFLKEIKDYLTIPVIAIGGIKATNIEELIKLGIENVAISADILLSKDPCEQTKIIKEKITGSKKD